MSNTNGNALDLVSGFLKEARAKKSANLSKSATDPSDPTSHPVMKVDDGTKPAQTGARSSENTSDVKKALGEGGITGQEDANSADQHKPSDDIGTKTQASDEVKGNVATPKATKDAPESSHPTNALFNEKYSSVTEIGKRLVAAISDLTKAANVTLTQAPVATPAPTTNKEAELKTAAAQKYTEDAEAGYLAAELLARSMGFGKEAAAEQAQVDSCIGNIVKSAEADAELFVDFLAGHMQGVHEAQTKKANHLPEDPAAAGGGELPPELAAAMGGGGGEMGGGPPPEMGGGPPPEMGGGGGEGGDATIEALAQALDEAGVTPEELVAALEAEMGGGGGGEMGGGGPPPEMGGGGPPPPPGPEAGAGGAEPAAEEEVPSKEPKEAAFSVKPKGIPGKVKPAGSAPVKQAAAMLKNIVAHSRQNKLASVLRQVAK